MTTDLYTGLVYNISVKFQIHIQIFSLVSGLNLRHGFSSETGRKAKVTTPYIILHEAIPCRSYKR